MVLSQMRNKRAGRKKRRRVFGYQVRSVDACMKCKEMELNNVTRVCSVVLVTFC